MLYNILLLLTLVRRELKFELLVPAYLMGLLLLMSFSFKSQLVGLLCLEPIPSEG